MWTFIEVETDLKELTAFYSMVNFAELFKITVLNKKEVDIPVSVHEARFPAPVSILDEFNFHDQVSMHRIFVNRNRGFTVIFENMASTHSFQARESMENLP